MHITLFMTSQPADPRPDPFNEFGGGQSQTLAEGRIPAPKAPVLAAEKDAFRTLAAQTPAPTLEVRTNPFCHGLVCTVCKISALKSVQQQLCSAKTLL